MERDRMTLFGKGECVKTEIETAKILNEFFSYDVNNLEISKYLKDRSLIGNIEGQTLRIISKYKNHSGIVAIQKILKVEILFTSENSKKREIQKENHKLNANKSSQNSDISSKIIYNNLDIFNNFLCVSINSSIKYSLLSSYLKTADITPIYKKG